jgi:glutamyl-tRNA synthetase
MRELPLADKVAGVLPYVERAGLVQAPVSDATRAQVARVVEILGDRIRVFGDILLQAPFFFLPDDQVVFDDKAFAKRLLAPGAADLLADYRGWLADQSAFDAPSLEKGTHDLMAARDLGLGDIVHAVRVAVTGVPAGPGLFDTLAVLGKDACLRRIDRALAKARAG